MRPFHCLPPGGFCWVALALMASGCVSVPSPEAYDALQEQRIESVYVRADYTAQPGDFYRVLLFRKGSIVPEFSDTLRVQPDGKAQSRHLKAPLDVTGLTPTEIEQRLEVAYAPLFPDATDLTVTVSFARHLQSDWFPDEVVVLGQVRTPTMVPYKKGLSVVKSLAVAAGMNDLANKRRVVLLRSSSPKETTTREIDVLAMLRHEADDVEVFPGDIVYVPMSGIAKVDLWVRQYIRGFLIVRPLDVLRILLLSN